jgi:hypothetical protein
MAEVSSSSYSETDADNDEASPDGFPEGMAMAGLNNSARAVMGALKRFWTRIQGAYASTGSANAYVLTPTVALAAYVTGERYSFRANFSNTATATLNISGIGAKTIKKFTASGSSALAANDIRSGQPVTVEYDGTDLILVTPTATTLTDLVTSDLPSGTIAQVVGTQDGAVATGTTVLPGDDTIPQNTEGDQYLSQAITPTNASSILQIDVVWNGTNSAGANQVVALFQDSTASAIGAVAQLPQAAGTLVNLKFSHRMTAGTTSATTFKVRAGAASAGTTTFNGSAGARLFGGVMRSSIIITEILP